MGNTKLIKKVLILFVGVLILTGCSLFGREKSFTEEEILEYSQNNYAVGDMEFVEDYYDDYEADKVNWKYHYFKYKEQNERGLEFLVLDVKRYDGKLTSSNYYHVKTDFDQKVLLDYVSKNELPEGVQLSNSEGLYSFAMSEGVDKPYKLVVSYDSNTFDQKLETIYNYVSKMNDYNKEITGTKNNLYVYLYFSSNYGGFDVKVFDKDVKDNGECSYKNFKKCVTNMKKNK